MLMSHICLSQEKTVTGIVSDASGPLPGVSILIKNTERGTTTNFHGNYSLKANSNDTLVFSLIGMKRQKIRAEKNEINVQLEESDESMEVIHPYDGYPRVKRNPAGSFMAYEPEKRNKNAAARHNFRINTKNNVFVIFVPELIALSKEESLFQENYKIVYVVSTHNNSISYIKKHNKLTFRHLNKKFKKSWQTAIRKDAFGLDDYLK